MNENVPEIAVGTIRVVTESKWICTDRYHQDWRELEKKTVKLFHRHLSFRQLWSQRPKDWYELNPNIRFCDEDDLSFGGIMMICLLIKSQNHFLDTIQQPIDRNLLKTLFTYMYK